MYYETSKLHKIPAFLNILRRSNGVNSCKVKLSQIQIQFQILRKSPEGPLLEIGFLRNLCYIIYLVIFYIHVPSTYFVYLLAIIYDYLLLLHRHECFTGK